MSPILSTSPQEAPAGGIAINHVGLFEGIHPVLLPRRMTPCFKKKDRIPRHLEIANSTKHYPWGSKTKQRMVVFRMIHVKDSLLPMGKVWSLDFLGYSKEKKTEVEKG